MAFATNIDAAPSTLPSEATRETSTICWVGHGREPNRAEGEFITATAATRPWYNTPSV